jgi:hypothetical protein
MKDEYNKTKDRLNVREARDGTWPR